MNPSQKDVKITIPAATSHLPILGACIRSLLDTVESPAEDPASLGYSIELSVQEIAANIVKHAYQGAEGQIEMSLSIETNGEKPRQLGISILSQGETFDPEAVEKPKLGELQEHGFGLFLVEELMDEVTYHHRPEGNLWQLAKQL